MPSSPSAIGVSTHDVTERTKADEAAVLNQQRLDLAVGAHTMGVFDWDPDAGSAAWNPEMAALFGFEPDPSMPDYPFHPESRHTAIAVLSVDGDRVEASVIPCWIDDEARPVPVGRSERGDEVAAYLRRITSEAGFDTELRWDGERLAARTKED